MSIPTRFCNQCGQEDHGSAGCHTSKGFSQANREMEKLVAELDSILAIYQWKSTRYVPIAGWMHIINRVLSAIHNGKVKLPGEIERFSVYGTNPEHIQNMWYRRMVEEDAYHIIALRREEDSSD